VRRRRAALTRYFLRIPQWTQRAHLAVLYAGPFVRRLAANLRSLPYSLTRSPKKSPYGLRPSPGLESEPRTQLRGLAVRCNRSVWCPGYPLAMRKDNETALIRRLVELFVAIGRYLWPWSR